MSSNMNFCLSGETFKLIYTNNLLVNKVVLGIKKTKGKQTYYVCFPDVKNIGEEPSLGTKSVPPERRRKSTSAIL
jgi:hypothetical protein